MKEKISDIWNKIRELPLIIKITVCVCVVVVIVGIILAVCILHQSSDEMEMPTESEILAEIPTEATEALEQEPETETQMEENQEVVPILTACSMVAESLEKNLDIYFVDNNGELITDVAFQVKVLPADQQGRLQLTTASEEEPTGISSNTTTSEEEPAGVSSDTGSALRDLQEAMDWLTELSTQQAEMEEQIGTVDFSIDDYETLLIQKKYAIDSYSEALNNAPGEFYTDDDKSGSIYIDNIRAGDYILCFAPVENPETAEAIASIANGEGEGAQEYELPVDLYDAKEYGVNVKIKSQADYTVLQYIENKVEEAEKAGDVKETHDNIKVQKTEPDTVAYADEFSIQQTSDYTETDILSTDLKVKASVSSGRNKATRDCVVKTDTPDGSVAESTESTEQAMGNTTVQSKLEVSKKVKLYANEDQTASSAVIAYTASNVEKISLTASSTVKKYVKLSQQQDGFAVTIKNPAKIGDDLEGELILSGIDASGQTIQVECKLTIVGTETKLKYNKQKLFIENAEGAIVRANVGNYKSGQIYYIAQQSEVTSYYGWQTIGKKRYFYDETGQIVKGKQRIGGVNYKFDNKTGELLSASVGVDVSSWQGDIDWEQASSCVTFAMIRCGFRGTSGKLAADTKYIANVSEARKNGILVGVYFHSRAKTVAQAVEEASLAVALAKNAGDLNLPIYLEMDDSVQGSLSKEQRTAIVKAFCATVGKGGFKSGIAASTTDLNKNLTMSELSDYYVWCMQYHTSCTYKGGYDIWQYTSKGRVPGIAGYVDLDLRK